MYEYRAKVIRVVDADTFHLDVDLGCEVRILLTVRLADVNAPEARTIEGTAATAWVKEILPPGTAITLRTIKDRKERYGRYLGVILLGDLNLGDELVRLGHATPVR